MRSYKPRPFVTAGVVLYMYVKVPSIPEAIKDRRYHSDIWFAEIFRPPSYEQLLWINFQFYFVSILFEIVINIDDIIVRTSGYKSEDTGFKAPDGQ
jgi:hypothetical protein